MRRRKGDGGGLSKYDERVVWVRRATSTSLWGDGASGKCLRRQHELGFSLSLLIWIFWGVLGTPLRAACALLSLLGAFDRPSAFRPPGLLEIRVSGQVDGLGLPSPPGASCTADAPSRPPVVDAS